MKEGGLTKLRGDLASMRRSPQTAASLERIAARLGRKKTGGGKHPMWMSQHFNLPPLAISHHGGRDLPPGTRNSILNQLDEDVLAWEERLQEQENHD